MLFLALCVLYGASLSETKAQTTFCTLHDTTPVYSSPHLKAPVSTALAKDICFIGEVLGDWVRNLEIKKGFIHVQTIYKTGTQPNYFHQRTHTGVLAADASHELTARSRRFNKGNEAILEKPGHQEEKRFLLDEGTLAEWSSWSECDNSTCDVEGTRNRTRKCFTPIPNVQPHCMGETIQSEACTKPCLGFDGSWGAWEGWSVCYCNGFRPRDRKCDSPPPLNGGQYCNGSEFEVGMCNRTSNTNCPVDGKWGSWYPWSECSTTCGPGEMSRLRLCNNPRPENGGLYCDVHEKGEMDLMGCQGPPCPINGSWSDWTAWSTCSVTCGIGSHSRNRSCDHPAPAHGGVDCAGSDSENRNCTKKPCPIDGSWSGWSVWSACDVTCATGTRHRVRTCDSPAPKYGGQPCNETADQFDQCQETPCPIDGVWGAWQSWTSCSVTCLNGTRSRTRLCDSPAPQHGGSDCAGQQNGTQTCTPRDNCDVDGGWTEWGLWSLCDVICATGHHNRYRLCENPTPENLGKYCEGPENEVGECFDKPCPIDGGFGAWMAWGSCFPSTGNGLRTRSRLCDNPQPRNGGRNCQGKYTEQLPCCDSDCPVDGGWSYWSTWSDCPADSFVHTTKSRTRTCSMPPPQFGGANCAGDSVETDCCPVNGGFGAWSVWSVCSGNCIDAHRERDRQCNNPRPSCGGRYCGSGIEVDHTCIPDHCTTTTTATTTTTTTTATPSAGSPETTATGLTGTISSAATFAPSTALTSTVTSVATFAITTDTQLSTSTLQVTAGTTPCTMETSSNCHWHNVASLDQMNWIVYNGSTPTDDTGPTVDHTFGNNSGKYIYLESSAPSSECDKAWYQSDVIQPGVGTPGCFQFWYHMYGNNAGSLNIYMATGSHLPGQLLWTVSGNQGNRWNAGNVPLRATSNFSIIAEGTVGNGYLGDIGLDDLLFTQATCSLYPTTAYPYPLSAHTCSATTTYNGVWSKWFNDKCSVTCGNGTLTRVRHCSTGHAEDCAGSSTDVVNCQMAFCKVDGSWSSWSPWSRCDVTCADGHIHRTRTCTDPAPAFGGLNCSGTSQETNMCSLVTCPVWSRWFNDKCSVTCGNGTLTRVRHCSTGHAEDCTGNRSEVIDCQDRPCKVDGSWSWWSPWSQCDVTCENGHIHRTRTCTNPAPAFGGLNCSGTSQEINACMLANCPSWSKWFFDDCSVTCGDGTQSRFRMCSSGHDEDCPGPAFDTVPCSMPPC